MFVLFGNRHGKPAYYSFSTFCVPQENEAAHFSNWQDAETRLAQLRRFFPNGNWHNWHVMPASRISRG